MPANPLRNARSTRPNPVFRLGLAAVIAWWGATRPAVELARAEDPPSTQTKPEPEAAQQSAVDELAGWVTARKGTLSASVVDAGSGLSLAAFEPERNQNPASTQKLVTAAVALHRLGPNHRFTTSVHGDFDPSRESVRRLVLKGGGDPSLDVGYLARLAASLHEMGIRVVEAGIQVDQSVFDDQFVPPAFGQQPNEWASFRAPVSALALENNAVTLNVLPVRAGGAARVWFDPPGFVDVHGQVTTKPAGSGQNALLTLQPEAGRLVAKVGGHVAEGLPRMRFSRRVDDPRLFAGHVFRELLSRAGIQVQGEVAEGRAQGAPLAFVESPPLSVLLLPVGKDSNNFYAEMIFKALGASNDRDSPASSERAAQRVREWLKAEGWLSDATRVTNGSGLFDANRLSAKLLTSLLVKMHRNPRTQPEYLSHLSIGGVDGTLKSRFRNFAESRAVRAKSGTLRDTVALSGYLLRSKQRSPIAFAFLVNGVSASHGEIRDRIDRVVAGLSN